MARFKQEVYDAYEKDAADRTFWEKIQAAYAGPLIEADKEKNKGSSVLPEDYLDFVEKLNLDVQDDINHYLNIFRNDNRPVLKHIDENKTRNLCEANYFCVKRAIYYCLTIEACQCHLIIQSFP